MRIGFITNFCPHYRLRTFEMISRRLGAEFLFFSGGQEWYWSTHHGVRHGDFPHEYLRPTVLGAMRVYPILFWKLWRGGYDAYVCIPARVALLLTYLSARLRHRPVVLWTGIWSRLGTPLHRISFPLVRYIYRHCDAVVVYGEHVKRYLVTEGVAAERVFVAPHAIDNAAGGAAVTAAERAAIRAKLEVGDDERLVLYLGRLEDGKGLPFLVEAFARLGPPDTILVLAGVGSEASTLAAAARARGIADRVRFPGYVAPDETRLYYAAADVGVLPSVTTPRFKEPWGLVVNEAFNQGLPVIATDAVGAAAGGLLRDEETGLVVPERDAAALAAALRRVLEDTALRARLSEAARRAVAIWDNAAMVEGFRRALAYAGVTDASSPPAR
jgi:glycosyltransferase involved in cell wall biosynthesis